MTRFARAKGSKASNERLPEPATPWREMKAQLMNKYKEKEESLKKEEVDERRTKTYESFLKEKEEEDAKNIKWAEFPGVAKKAKNKFNRDRKIKNAVKTGLAGKDQRKNEDPDEMKEEDWEALDNDYSDGDGDEEFESLKQQLEMKLKKEVNGNAEGSDDETPEETSAKIQPKQPNIKKQKAKKQKLSISTNGSADTPLNITKKKKHDPKAKELKPEITNGKTTITQETPEEIAKRRAEKKLERRKIQILKKKERKQESTEEKVPKPEAVNGNTTATDEITKRKHEKKLERRRMQKLRKKQALQQNAEGKSLELKKPLKEMTAEEKEKVDKHKLKILAQKQKSNGSEQTAKDNKKSKKGKEQPKLENIKINGEEVELVRYDGYPVRKEDYNRLVELEKEMRIKGIPLDEIKRALKLERRRAEKFLARLKKKLCFHCRLGGHNLSECPKLGEFDQKDVINSGICFKCGSTEHTHYNCRVVRGEQYKYAMCFICKEQGHISKQCPENSRGLYPKGGACRVCGDVTHLKKDCPRYQAQQEQNAVVANTIDSNGNVEVLEGEGVGVRQNPKKKSNKIIKF